MPKYIDILIDAVSARLPTCDATDMLVCALVLAYMK